MPLEPIFAGIAARCPKLRTGIDIAFPDRTAAGELRRRFPGVWMTVADSGSASTDRSVDNVHPMGPNDTLPFEDNQFEVAVLNGPRISQGLVRDIHRILRPEGLLFFSVEEKVRHGTDSTLSWLYNTFLKCGYDVVTVSRPPWWHFGRDGRLLTVCARKKNWHTARSFKVLGMIAVLALALAGRAASPANGDGEAIVRLLNSRSAMSPKTYAAAAEKVREAADAGGVLQRYVIAIVSEDVNAPKAARLTPKARQAWLDDSRERIRVLAEQKDNPLAWYLLSLEKNDRVALERAAEGGNVQAQNAWGTILISQALAMNITNAAPAAAALEKGFDCFKSAAAKKDGNGLYNLGMCYMQGYGCRIDRARAFQCFRAAAEEGHPEAINNIGGFYRDGIIVPTNATLSVRWFRKSAELGNPYGQLNYALALERGDGTPRDPEKALVYFKAAAEQNCPEAMTAYGMCFHAGRGVEKNPEIAFRWFRRAAEAGFPPAMENLATCYERGDGTPRDILKSAVWKMRGRAAMGDVDARNWVERREREMSAQEGKKP